MIVYKFVRVVNGGYFSAHAVCPKLRSEYRIGLETIPIAGPLFAYGLGSRCATEGIYTGRAGLYQFSWSVLECEAEQYQGSLREQGGFLILLRPFEDILTLENARLFWDEQKDMPENYHVVQWRDTKLCRSITPIREVPYSELASWADPVIQGGIR